MNSACRFLFYILFLCLCILCLSYSDSYAAHELFERMDSDSDGKISPGEFRDNMKKHAFQVIDKNADREIEAKEWQELKNISERDRHLNLFEKIDKDKDRRISFFEFSDYADKLSNISEAFMGLDSDNNNSLTPDEITVRPLFKMITIKFN